MQNVVLMTVVLMTVVRLIKMTPVHRRMQVFLQSVYDLLRSMIYYELVSTFDQLS
jgi:F0F1-type ATP synthase membrane subunit a